MSQRVTLMTALAVLVAALTTTMLGRDREPAAAGVAAATPASASCGPISYNRSIDAIGFSTDPTGAPQIDVQYSLLVGDTAGAALNMDADILVEVLVGGAVVFSTTFPGENDFLANDAVVCAVSCASNCGSIFGDGVCLGCSCNYSRSQPLPGIAIATGDMVRATILPLAASAPEIRTDDDVLEVTFGGPAPCPSCPWDFNRDNVVDTVDFLQLLANWGPCP